jgi:hypothetical protein
MFIYLSRYLLKRILKKQCGYAVPRTGEEGQTVNCYYAHLFKNEKPYMVIKKVQENSLEGKLWTEQGYGEAGTVENNDLKNYEIRITHFNGLYETRYKGLLDYLLTGYTKIDQLKCIYYKWTDNTQQFLFNRRLFATFDRIEILRALIEMKFTGDTERFMTIDLMTQVYSLRWIGHPEGDIQTDRLQLFVDSFVESGELTTDDGVHYTVTGKAINTLSQYEEQERRHTENRTVQKGMLLLTIAIVAVGILQAYITYIKK